MNAIVMHPTVGLIGGKVVETHADGTVTINWAGFRVSGAPLSHEDVLAIESGDDGLHLPHRKVQPATALPPKPAAPLLVPLLQSARNQMA